MKDIKNIQEEMQKATPIFAALANDINRAAKECSESLRAFANSIKPMQVEWAQADKKFRTQYGNLMGTSYVDSEKDNG